MNMETKIIPVKTGEGDNDVVHLNATHYSAMTKDEAVDAMKADGVSKDAAWAGKAWSAMRKAVAEQRKVSEADLEKEAEATKPARLAELNRVRAMSGVEPVKDAQTLEPQVNASNVTLPEKGSDKDNKSNKPQ